LILTTRLFSKLRLAQVVQNCENSRKTLLIQAQEKAQEKALRESATWQFQNQWQRTALRIISRMFLL